MASIILELQEKCTDSTNDIVDLLRKAKLVAVKLGLDDFNSWIDCELNGYENPEYVPEYRHIKAEMKVINPVQGRLQPLCMDSDMESQLCNIPYQGPISSAAECAIHKDASGPPTIPLTSPQKNFLLNHMEYQLEPVRVVNRGYFSSIIDAVRSRLLEIALDLEKKGVVGEGMSFTPEEKARVSATTTYHIDTVQGVVGDIYGGSLNQRFTLSIKKNDIESLKLELKKSGLQDSDLDQLESAIANDASRQVGHGHFGSAVSDWVGTMVSKASAGTWDIGVAAAGSLLGEALKAYYGL